MDFSVYFKLSECLLQISAIAVMLQKNKRLFIVIALAKLIKQ